MMRAQILEGNLSLPSMHKFIGAIGTRHALMAEEMFKAMWYNYLKNKGSISLTYWADKFNNAKVFNMVLIALSDAEWIISHSIPARNWAEAELNEDKLLKFVDVTELERVRAHYKHRKYTLKDEESTKSTLTRLNGKTRNTGLVRQGFMKAGNTRFKYDLEYMSKYRKPIQLNLTKSMDKIAEIWPELRHDKASYDTISIEMMEYYENSTAEYTRGNNINDSRGRAISSCLGRIGNPISCKDFRSLLVIC